MKKEIIFTFGILLFLIPFVSADEFDGNDVILIATEDLATTVNSLIDPYGVTTNGVGSSPDTIYIMDHQDARLWSIDNTFNNKTGGNSLTSFFTGTPDDLWTNGTDFWIINDGGNFVYHVNSTFDNQTDGFSTPSGANTDGLSGNASNLFLVPSTSSTINVYDYSGSNLYNISCTTAQHCNGVESITYFDNFFYLLDSTEDIHKINSSGATVASRNVDNIGGGIVASGNLNSFTTTNGNDFWLIDRSEAGREIYHITYNDATPPDTSIVFPTPDFSSDIVALSDSFDIGGFGATDSVGIWGNGSDLWITDEDTIIVYHTTLNGTLLDNFSTSDFGAADASGIWGNDSDFWITDSVNDRVYHTTLNGTLLDNFSTSDFGAAAAFGIWGNDSDFWITDFGDSEVYHTTLNGTLIDSFDTSGYAIGFISGIWGNDSDFWITDDTGDEIDRVNMSGALIESIDVSDFTTSPDGIWGQRQDFWITDLNVDDVIHIKGIRRYDTTITELNYTASDDGVLNTCWYSLDSGGTNTTVTCGQNVTGLDSGEGNFLWTIYANDSFGNEGSSSINFSVSFEFQSLSLDIPTNNTFLNNGTNIDFNFTATDPNGVDTCDLYGNWSGGWHLNLSDSSITSGVQSNFKQNISDGTYIWNVFCNDTTNKGTFNESNLTFTVDTTFPVFNNVQITTTQGSQNVEFNVTSYTETNCDSTYYSVFLNGNIDNGIENVSTTCSEFSDTFTVSAFNTFTLRVYMNDSANNLNFTDANFTTSQLVVTPPSGGSAGVSGVTTIRRIQASNFSIQTTGGTQKMDVFLAKGSVRPRSRPFILINTDIEPVEVELRCDTTLLESNETTIEGEQIDICDYVSFDNGGTLTLSPNEEVPTEGIIKITTPPNASFSDEYNFNLLVVEKIDATQTGDVLQRFSKLSVGTRVPIRALVLKWSFLPFQDDEGDKVAYPVFWISALIAFLVFALTFFLLVSRLAATSFLLGIAFFLATLFSLLFVL